MPVQQINGAAGTIQVKVGSGKIWSVVGVAAGTSYTFQIKDGPDSAGNAKTIMGQNAAIPVVAGCVYFQAHGEEACLTFLNGFQMVVTGTPGDIEVSYE